MDVVTRKQAIERNSLRYYTGKPCLRGHLSERLVSDKSCLQCKKERNERTPVKEKNSTTRKARYVRNKEKEIRQTKEYREARKDWHKAYLKEYQSKNSERIAKRKAEYYLRNKERIQQRCKYYRVQNQADYNCYSRTRRLARLNRTPKWANISKIKEIYKKCKEISLNTGVLHHVDHIIPIISPLVSGLHVENNLQIIPAVDNLRKSNKWQS